MLYTMLSPMSVIYCYRGVLYFGGLALLSSGYFALARKNALSVEVLTLIAHSTRIFAFFCVVTTIHYLVLAILFRKERTLAYPRLVSAVVLFIFSVIALFQSQFFLSFSVG